MSRPIVAMVCGPHAPGYGSEWDPQFIRLHRIDAAIAEAGRLCAPLFIAGDGWNGKDVRYLFARAVGKVSAALPLYHPGKSTLTDVQAVLRELATPTWSDISQVRLVTDPEHRRPLVFAEAEARRLVPGRSLEFVHVHAPGGHVWSRRELEGEEQGIADYLAGQYGQRRFDGLEAHGKHSPSSLGQELL